MYVNTAFIDRIEFLITGGLLEFAHIPGHREDYIDVSNSEGVISVLKRLKASSRHSSPCETDFHRAGFGPIGVSLGGMANKPKAWP
jgi:hypothetical protein